MQNADLKTVEGFGEEWASYDQSGMNTAEFDGLFDAYFSLFPFTEMKKAEGVDVGCGSGRWANGVAPKVGYLHCVDPAKAALDVARGKLVDHPNVSFHEATTDAMPFDDASMDFAYSLGVLHHIPDTLAAMKDCVRILKPRAPFLVYLYYGFDNKPAWFRALWSVTDVGRRGISRLPFRLRKAVTTVIAGTVYWPLARGAALLEKAGANVATIPLAPYRKLSFYTMRTDALDRFGTRLEQRFTRPQIAVMMELAGLTEIQFREGEPYWVAMGRKA